LILQVLQDQFFRPKEGIVMPPLGMKIHHDPVGQLPVFAGFDNIVCRIPTCGALMH